MATLHKDKRLTMSRLLKEVGADQDIIDRFKPKSSEPLRQYFHSRTNEAMQRGEWNIDSDFESDGAWRDEFGDLVS